MVHASHDPPLDHPIFSRYHFQGRILDSSGVEVPFANLEAMGDSGVVHAMTASAEGHYHFTLPGSKARSIKALRVSRSDYGTQVQKCEVKLSVDSMISVDFALKSAHPVSGQIEVIRTPPLVAKPDTAMHKVGVKVED